MSNKQKNYYIKNKEKIKEASRARKQEVRKWYQNLKSQMQCKDCGENHISCLTFHHRDPTLKDIKISAMIANRKSKEAILKEIDKCDVLCANCHAKLHWNESH